MPREVPFYMVTLCNSIFELSDEIALPVKTSQMLEVILILDSSRVIIPPEESISWKTVLLMLTGV